MGMARLATLPLDKLRSRLVGSAAEAVDRLCRNCGIDDNSTGNSSAANGSARRVDALDAECMDAARRSPRDRRDSPQRSDIRGYDRKDPPSRGRSCSPSSAEHGGYTSDLLKAPALVELTAADLLA